MVVLARLRVLLGLGWVALFAVLPLPAQFEFGDPFGTPKDEIPVAGRPEFFSGASGAFTVDASVDVTKLQVGEPLYLTLVVRAVTSARQPPEKFPLEASPELLEDFTFEPLPSYEPLAEATARVGLGSSPTAPFAVAASLQPRRSWMFRYRLRPKHEKVVAVPSIPFWFHDPRIPIAERSFQSRYTPPIPLEVRPREIIRVPIQAPRSFFHLPNPEQLATNQQGFATPSPVLWFAIVLLPPLGCLIWFGLWHWLYPDHARQMSRRRSRAASLALRQLDGTDRLPVSAHADHVARTVTGYLQQRLGLPVSETTPREAGYYLTRTGCSRGIIHRAVAFFERCDSERFRPVERSETNLADEANALILDMEAET